MMEIQLLILKINRARNNFYSKWFEKDLMLQKKIMKPKVIISPNQF
jgi:hypothetical protein